MQNFNCETCQSLFTDALQDELSSTLKSSFVVHLEECSECASLFSDFKKLSEMMENEPVPSLSPDFKFDIHKIKMSAKQVERRRNMKQWASMAAVFIVFFSIYTTFENKEEAIQEDRSLSYNQEDATDMYADSLGAEKTQEICGMENLNPEENLSLEVFQEALLSPSFASEVEAANLGFGYELLQYTQEEDGSFTFVIYFYEDQTYHLVIEEPFLNNLLLPNVRSFHWKKNE